MRCICGAVAFLFFFNLLKTSTVTFMPLYFDLRAVIYIYIYFWAFGMFFVINWISKLNQILQIRLAKMPLTEKRKMRRDQTHASMRCRLVLTEYKTYKINVIWISAVCVCYMNDEHLPQKEKQTSKRTLKPIRHKNNYSILTTPRILAYTWCQFASKNSIPL